MRSSAYLALVLALAMVASPFTAAAVKVDCKYDTGLGATYDLSLLHIPGAYSVLDADAANYNFTYFFNVCGDTAEYPYTSATPATDCETTKGSDGVEQTGPAPAWQLYNENNMCHRLGSSATNMEWSLLDEYDVVRGVTVEYTGGDMCAYGARSLSLHFQCSDGGSILHLEPVVETDCKYEIYLKSTFGCPTQCFGSNLKLCSSNGVCGYDTDAKAARCFCNPGYTGSFCSDVVTDDSGLSAAGGVLIFVSILLALVLGVLGYLWYRIKSLRLDPAAYDTLSGGPDDDAGLDMRPVAAAPAGLSVTVDAGAGDGSGAPQL